MVFGFIGLSLKNKNSKVVKTFIYLFYSSFYIMDNETSTKPSIKQRFTSFIVECKRVWQVTKKPNKEELKVILKVTGIGILLIGLIGFIINMAWQLGLK